MSFCQNQDVRLLSGVEVQDKKENNNIVFGKAYIYGRTLSHSYHKHNVNFGFCQVLILLIYKYCQSQDTGLLKEVRYLTLEPLGEMAAFVKQSRSTGFKN